MQLYNLFLAGLWLVLGVSLIVYDQINPGGAGSFRFQGMDISLGWVALVLAGFNLLRAWSRWTTLKARRLHEEADHRRKLGRRVREFHEAGQERDPNFIFDESQQKEE
jgi:hypothetical protein